MNDNAPSSANGPPSLKDRVRELQLSNQLGAGRSSKGGSSTTWLPWLLCILMALAWAGMGIRWYRGGGSAGPGSTNEAGAGKDRSAAADPSQIAAGEIVLDSKGYLIPSHSIPISPIDVAGRVIELNIEEGMTFQKGDVLAIIDSTRFDAEVKEAEAQQAASKARYLEIEGSWAYEKQQADAEVAEARAQVAKDELEYQTAQSTLSGAVAKLELGLLRKKMEATKERQRVVEIKAELTKSGAREQRITAAKRDMEAADARLEKAVWSQENCTIKAPVTGVILTKKAELGSLINPVVGGVSTSLCEMADLSQLEVDLEIQERDIAKIKEDMVCRVRADAWPAREYKGYVDRLMPIANRARGIIQVRVKVILPADEKQGKYLKPEMGVSVTFYNTIDKELRQAAEAKVKSEVKPPEPRTGPASTKKRATSEKLP